MTDFKSFRKGRKIKIKDIGLHYKTVKAIEDGKKNMSVEALETYCSSVGLKIVFTI